MPHYLAVTTVILTLLHYVINTSIINKRGYSAFPFSVLMQVIIFLLLDVTVGGSKILWPLMLVNCIMTISIVITAYTVYFKKHNVMLFYHDCTHTLNGWFIPVMVLTAAIISFHAITGTVL